MFTENHLIKEVSAPVSAANNTDSNTDIIDMTGWDGVVFIQPLEDSVGDGVAHLKAEGNTANADSGMAALTGADATATSSVNDDLNGKLLVVDVYKPLKRYIQAVRTSATQNIAFGTCIAILYRGRKAPITDDATILDVAAVAGV